MALSLANLQLQTAMIGLEECGDGPVLAVVLRPEDSPVLKFGKRLEFLGALFGRANCCPTDSGQVDDGDGAGRDGRLGDSVGDDAPQPNGRAGPVGLVVGAENQEMRQHHSQPGDQSLPLPLFVGPEDRGRLNRIVVVVLRGLLERGQQGVENRSGGLRWHGAHFFPLASRAACFSALVR